MKKIKQWIRIQLLKLLELDFATAHNTKIRIIKLESDNVMLKRQVKTMNRAMQLLVNGRRNV